MGNMAAAAGVIGGSDGLWGSFPDVCRVILDQMGLSSWGPLPEPDDGRGSAFPVSLEHPRCNDEVAAPWVVGGGFADAGAGGPGTVRGGHPWRESCHWLASLEAAITLVEEHLAMRPDEAEGYGLGQWHEASPSSWLHKEEAPQKLLYWLPEHKRQIVQMQIAEMLKM